MLIINNFNNGFLTISNSFCIQKCYLKLFNYISNLIALITLFTARKYYIKSLLGCNGDEGTCVLNNNIKYIFDDIYYCIHSIFYFLCFLILIQVNLCSKYQLIIFLLIIIELIIKDHDDNFLHHGMLNLTALFVLLTLGEIIIVIITTNHYILVQ